jgi:hypothetical protein
MTDSARRNSQASVTVLHERPPLRDDLAHALTLSRQLRQLSMHRLDARRAQHLRQFLAERGDG